jgi:hypothetical protein
VALRPRLSPGVLFSMGGKQDLRIGTGHVNGARGKTRRPVPSSSPRLARPPCAPTPYSGLGLPSTADECADGAEASVGSSSGVALRLIPPLASQECRLCY